MCFYAYKNVLEPMGHLGANLIFSILTLNQVKALVVVNGRKRGPLTTMKIGSTGMSTSHWYAVVALWFAPGAEEGHGTAQRARTYSTALVSKSD